MARTSPQVDPIAKLLDESSRPLYVVDAQRRIVYCNRPLGDWMDLEAKRIVGRRVEYHSESPAAHESARADAAPLVDLCPPPQALAGESCVGTISCLARGGRLVHRKAEFVPLALAARTKSTRGSEAVTEHAVLVLLAESDMSAEEIAAEISGSPSADELHRAIRRFRHTQATRYSLESLLGSSTAMQKVRSQVVAAAASGANTLICGPRGSGRGHVARAIHYHQAADTEARLVALDCGTLTDDVLRQALESLRLQRGEDEPRPTLLLEQLDMLSPWHQAQLRTAIEHRLIVAQVVATCTTPVQFAEPVPDAGDAESRDAQERAEEVEFVPAGLDRALVEALSTIRIQIPTLRKRLEDLPILAQYFVETCNRGSSKQVGALRSDALDILALYAWPGELAQLRTVIAAAHETCAGYQVTPADLPPLLRHASQAASRSQRQPERIVLDELLSTIEREAIVRALAQAGGNKSEAAELLGMTRPRLYRRLVQLGLAGESPDTEPLERPEFIEQNPAE